MSGSFIAKLRRRSLDTKNCNAARGIWKARVNGTFRPAAEAKDGTLPTAFEGSS